MIRGSTTRVWALLLSGLLLAAAPPGALAQDRFTLEEVLAAPFATRLVGAPSGEVVAWVENVRGVRNVWVAGGPSYRGRQLTRYTGDDGQVISDLAFTPDGTGIVYVRGGAQSGAPTPHAPNPTFDPEGKRWEILVVRVADGEVEKLAEGEAPTVSPSGRILAFLVRGEVWTVPLVEEGGRWRAGGQPAKLIHDRGRVGSLRWSPEGDRLAFTLGRGSHGFVGVYDFRSRSLAYPDPSVDRDLEPSWSPDGERLAFIRVPASAPAPPSGRGPEGAEPWSIRVVDLRTGRGREVWRAKRGAGSEFVYFGFYRSPLVRNLLWGTGDRLLFPWERTGWVHLYSVPVQGGEATELTPGEFEVEQPVLSSDRREVIYSSNQGDVDRRHLWRTSVTGGGPVSLTSGRGIEWSPVVTAGGEALAFLASGGRIPPRAEILPLAGPGGGPGGTGERRPLAPGVVPPEFPAEEMVEPRRVVFSATDGWRIPGQLFLPREQSPGERHPAVIYLHGGSRAQMLLGYHNHRADYYQKMYALNQYLANRGYVVLSVNYRSGIGYGKSFREAPNYGARGASELQDVLGAGLYLQSRPDVDPDRIGLWGGSYGGYLTALGLAHGSDLFAAGVDLHGVHDWSVRLGAAPSGYTAAEWEERRRVAYLSSPVAHVEDWRSPVLIVHGDDDRNVDFSQTVDLVARLRRQGVELEYLVLPNETHSFLLHSSWRRAFEAAADFFERKLKRRQPSN